MQIKWIFVVVSRKRPFPNNYNPNSRSCSLPKSTCLVLNSFKQSPKNFHKNYIDIPNVSKPLLKNPSDVQIGHSRLCKEKNLFFSWSAISCRNLVRTHLDLNVPCEFPWAPFSRLQGGWGSWKVIHVQMGEPLGTSNGAFTDIDFGIQMGKKS